MRRQLTRLNNTKNANLIRSVWKQVADYFNIGLSGLVTRKLRSSLAILGIVIGVAAVIALMGIGKGTEASILTSIEGMGSNLLYVTPGATTDSGGIQSAAGSATTLTQEDAAAIAQYLDHVNIVAPYHSLRKQIVAGEENSSSSVVGITPDYQIAYNQELAQGNYITEYEYQSGIAIAVLGADVKETLFGEADAVGETIRIAGINIQVAGVLESKGGFSQDDKSVFIPLTTMQQSFAQPRTAQGEHIVSGISLSLEDDKYADYVIAEVTSILRYRHHLDGNALDGLPPEIQQRLQANPAMLANLSATVTDDFTISSQQDIVDTLSEAMSSLTLLLGAIAGISLLVGGIGVMNIMLVSVIERTREIGIRKALGAQDSDIWIQFLVEAAMLTIAGGIIGIAVGWGAAALTSALSGMATLVTLDIILLAVGVSAGIGMFFGFYPAWSASRLVPVDALRTE